MIVRYLLNMVSNVLLFAASVLLTDGFGISRVVNKKRFVMASAATAALSAATFFLYESGINPFYLLAYPLIFVAAYSITFRKLNAAQFYVIIMMELAATLMSSCLSALMFRTGLVAYETAGIISQIFIRGAFLAFSSLLRRKSFAGYMYSALKSMPKHIFVFIFLALVLTDSLAICNINPKTNALKYDIIIVLLFLLTVTLVIIIFSLLMNVAARNYFNDLTHLLEKQVSAQINHYEKMEKLNNDMRTFRHDYINHLNSILALIDSGSLTDAKEYIEKLTDSAHSRSSNFHTGNSLADAILADKSDGCKEFADIEFDGYISDKIDNSDMCVILANSLDNAVEACRKCKGRSVIGISAGLRQGYWTMTMKNPSDVSENYEGIPATSKENTRDHGFGLLSIERTVKKYDGTMQVKNENMVFELSMALKV